MTKSSNYARPGSAPRNAPATPGGSGRLTVTDGVTTVSPTTTLELSGATVTDEGAGVASIAISPALDDLSDVTLTAPSDGDVLTYDDGTSQWVNASAAPATGSRQYVVGFDGGGSTLRAGLMQDVVAPFDATITGWEILADRTGSCVVDVWSDVYGNYPPTVADTIIDTGGGGVKPTLSGAIKAASSSLTGWDTAVTAGDILRFYLESASSITKFVLVVSYGQP